jgi:SAM-dependent methyltransferase
MCYKNGMVKMKKKLNVGCGKDIREDFVNLDVVELPGVDVVHDLKSFPWPFEESQFDEIHMINVLEHLPETIKTIEELHRISKPGATLIIRVPYWNSPDMLADPTHKSAFSERTLNFFDPAFPECKDRPYYSTARFHIRRKYCYLKFFLYLKLGATILTRPAFFIARYLGAIVWVIEFHLVASK